MSKMNETTTLSIDEGATFVTQLETLAKDKPDKPAYILVDKDLNRRVLTRQDVWDKSRKYAAILKRHGIVKGDIICNTLVNSPERLITSLGTITAGAISMHGQVLRTDGEDLISSLKVSKCKVIIIDPNDQVGACAVLDRIKYIDESTGSTRYSGLPELTTVLIVNACGVDESDRWITSIDKEEEMFVEETISRDDIVGIFTTSGTTGFSKLVMHTHYTLFTFGKAFGDGFGAHVNSVVFNMQSMGWLGGFPYHYLSLGNTRVCVDVASGVPSDLGTFIVKIFNQEQIQFGGLLTRDLHLVVEAVDAGTKLDRLLTTLATGGGPVHTAVMDAIGKLAEKMYIAYGGTEFGLVSNLYVYNKEDFQDMCSGKPFSSEIKIVGEEEGELPSERTGEILVRSQCLFKGYLNNPEKTKEAFTDDGWYKTGDMGYFDTKGQLFVLCRKSDAITKDGYIHYPGWMEQLVNQIPGIENGVVLGVPHPIRHEEICLCVKLSPGAELTVDEVREHCKKLFLVDENASMNPLPQYYLFFDEFIMNTNGKVDRRRMRVEACKRLDIQA